MNELLPNVAEWLLVRCQIQYNKAANQLHQVQAGSGIASRIDHLQRSYMYANLRTLEHLKLSAPLCC